MLLTESLPLGVVRLADRHARNDPPSDKDARAMKKAIRAVAKRAAEAVRKKGFKTCVGSSGTIQSLSLVHEAAVLGREPSPTGHRTLTRDGLKKVNRLLRRTTEKEKLRVPGARSAAPRHRRAGRAAAVLDPEAHRARRRSSWASGACARVCSSTTWPGTARPASPANRDMRARSVDRLLRRGNAEVLHAAHVARLALELFDQTHALHQLTATEREWLQYGALLHDIGCYIGYAKHQRHSYYLITHGDLTGFSADEIEVLASLARYHKGGGPKASHENWRRLNPYLQAVVEKLAAILRIADGLDRSHRQIVTGVSCRVRSRKIELEADGPRGLRARARRGAQEGGPVREGLRPRTSALRAVPAGREDVLQKDLEILSAEALWN